jgi:GntR family transcriptional regulator / MocR family aminotransferase
MTIYELMGMTIMIARMKRAPAIPPLVTIDRRSTRPLYRQLYEGYREAILEGRVRSGQRVPSTRALAADLGISRLTVLTAFEQLVAEGYFESRVGAGTLVARTLPQEVRAPSLPAARRPVGRRVSRRPLPRTSDIPLREPEPWLGGLGAFRVSQPAVEQFPVTVWSRLLARHSRNPRARWLHYGDPMGHRPFREAVASYLRTARAVRCEPDNVMVVSGSQQALAITARALLEAGDRVWVEQPGYRGARDVLSLVGARLVPVPVDDEGLDVTAGKAMDAGARAAYVTPSHQYPLGVTMSASRRLQLLEWARRAGAWVIEDDYDSEYRYENFPIAALQGLDRDARVIYVGTFSKVLFPALRLGYLVIPTDLVPRFVQVREAMDIFPASLPQAALADFILEGEFGRHLRRMRALYAERRTALANAVHAELGDWLNVFGDAAGMHLTVTGRRRFSDHAVALRAARLGLWVMPLSSCFLGKPTRHGLVLGYGGTTVAEIRSGVHRLRRLITTA